MHIYMYIYNTCSNPTCMQKFVFVPQKMLHAFAKDHCVNVMYIAMGRCKLIFRKSSTPMAYNHYS